MSSNHDLPGRRKWLGRMLSAAISVTVVAIGYPVLAFLRPRRTAASSGIEAVAPYRVDQLVLDANGQWPAPFDFGGSPCLLVKTPDGTVKAFNAVCTHLQCTVTFRQEKQDIFCNCHNGVFNLSGKNVGGPPPKPLEEYKVTLQGQTGQETIIVTRG